MNNQIQQKVNKFKVTVMQMTELKRDQEVKDFKKCPANRCHPAKCPNYEHC